VSDAYPSMNVRGSLNVSHSLTWKTSVNIHLFWNMTPCLLVAHYHLFVMIYQSPRPRVTGDLNRYHHRCDKRKSQRSHLTFVCVVINIATTDNNIIFVIMS
jgi:hypothetical protein